MKRSFIKFIYSIYDIQDRFFNRSFFAAVMMLIGYNYVWAQEHPLSYITSTFYPPNKVEGSGKWDYYVNKEGKVVIPCQWKETYDFHEGLACVKDDNGKYGLIDKMGKLVIPCQWEDCILGFNYFNEQTLVKDANGKYGLVDKTGNLVVSCQWGWIQSSSEGLSRVRDANGLWGYINKTGQVVIPCTWIVAYDFHNGYAEVMDFLGRSGLIDEKGKIVIQGEWKRISPFSEELACVQDYDNKYGYIDKTGKIVIPCQWKFALSFEKGVAWVKDTNGKFGLIDTTGKVVVPCQWEWSFSFSEGLSRIKDDNGEYGFVNKTGKVVIPCKWEDASNFSEGLAKVKDDNDKYGFIDKTGNIIIPCQWKNAQSFSEGLACIEDGNGKRGFIDKTGKVIIPCQWIDASSFFDDLARVKDDNNKYGFIDKTGRLIIPCQWDDAHMFSDGLALVRGIKKQETNDSTHSNNVNEINSFSPQITTAKQTSVIIPQQTIQTPLSQSPTTKPQRCIALVIGNDDYESRLANPVRDAKALKTEFESMGITTVMKLNGNQQEIEETVAKFAEQAKGYDAALFYFSGHALQMDGENYLIPVDANLPGRSAVKYKCVSLSSVIESMLDSGVENNVVILDACRNNPYVQRLYADKRSNYPKGLSNLSNLPIGLLLAFATQAGETAEDGTSQGQKNSPYATALLEALKRPQSIDAVFKQVKGIVMRNTEGKQIPIFVNNLKDELYLKTK